MDISDPMELMDDEEEATEYILNTTEDEYYKIMFGIDYKNDINYIQMINGKNYFFLETFPNACFSPNVFGKMSFGEAIFPKIHYSDLEKLRGNRDWHSVAREHVSAAFSGRNAQGGVH
jgi:hypothetical protein